MSFLPFWNFVDRVKGSNPLKLKKMLKYVQAILLQQTVLGLLFQFLHFESTIGYTFHLKVCKNQNINLFFRFTEKRKLSHHITDNMYRNIYVFLPNWFLRVLWFISYFSPVGLNQLYKNLKSIQINFVVLANLKNKSANWN